MKPKDQRQGFPFFDVIEAAESIAKTAKRHRHPLTGGGFYATKFAESHAEAVTSLQDLARKAAQLGDPNLDKALAELKQLVEVFFDASSDTKVRGQIKQTILFRLKADILPTLVKASSHAPSDKFFPIELVRGTRPYIERVALQACGSYDLGWYDAAAVMARRLLETLIIELYEAKGIDKKLKKPDSTFHYLSGLIAVLLAETTFNLGRNTKKALPHLKELGDQSAHSRRYIAHQQDLDGLKRDLRVAIEELVHLTGYK